MNDGKSFKELNTIDQQIKRLFTTGMFDGLQLRIELKCGFELFNTRAYHNYETWSHGYYASIPENNESKIREIRVEAEDLDVLVHRLSESLSNLDKCSKCEFLYKKPYKGCLECSCCANSKPVVKP
jgi:hypothetical protein